MPAVVLHLHISVEPDKREELLSFLRDARDYYEQGGDGAGGVHMRLLQDAEDENAFIEVFEYDTVEAYEADERRVAGDPVMQKVLAKWRSYLRGKPNVEVCIDLTDSDLLGEDQSQHKADGEPEDGRPADGLPENDG